MRVGKLIAAATLFWAGALVLASQTPRLPTASTVAYAATSDDNHGDNRNRDDDHDGNLNRDDREHGQDPDLVPNGTLFPNSDGASSTYSTTNHGIDLTGPFFQSLGTNGRSCGTCHEPSDGMSVSADHVQQRFDTTNGTDPIFRPVDGSNCDHNINVLTKAGRSAAYSLLRTRGLIRVAIGVPGSGNAKAVSSSTPNFEIVDVDNPYHCSETNPISMYRRPLPTANLPFLSAVMFDGRESSSATSTTKILYSNYPTSLLADLAHQSVDATNGHAQGAGTLANPIPNLSQQSDIVNFEMALFTAQATGNRTGRLDAQGAKGGPRALVNQPFFISINSSVNFLLPALEQPGGEFTPGDKKFSPDIFNIFNAWAGLPYKDPRAAVERGQFLFNSTPIDITGVAGINDDVASGGLVSGGIPLLKGTCGTCHDTPNVGNHSFPTPLNIGTGDPNPTKPSVNLGGLDISYLPKIRSCELDSNSQPTSTCITTTDLGQALVDGNFNHIGKIKGPILRGLSARAPYFHNGSAQTLLDVVHFYEVRFGVFFTHEEEDDLVAFLGSL